MKYPKSVKGGYEYKNSALQIRRSLFMADRADAFSGTLAVPF